MKTSNYLIALAALSTLTLVGCSDNDFLGDGPGGTFGSTSKGELSFKAGGGKTTRGEITGKDAATKLNEKFTVYGWKYVNTNAVAAETGFEDVFQDYVVKWEGIESAGTSESNTKGWEYVGYQSEPVDKTKSSYDQTIKYWDWSTYRYDFIAWSIAKGNGQIQSRAVVPGETKPAKNEPGLTFFAPTAKDLGGIFVSDKFTSIPKYEAGVTPESGTGETGQWTGDIFGGLKYVSQHPYATNHRGLYSQLGTNVTANQEKGIVELQFRNLAAKVRIGIYETIPGYKVSNVVFYRADGAENGAGTSGATAYQHNWSYSDSNHDYDADETYATLYAGADIFARSGQVDVKYHDGFYNTENEEYDNVAYTKITADPKYNYYAFGKLTNNRGTDTWISTNPIGETSSTASMSIGNDDEKLYTYVFPMETNENVLKLKVNYLLTSIDGSKENIRVTGANAVVPVEFAKWRSNYAYTYLFKVSDNTNGQTGTSVGPAGLYPITFDACLVNTEDGMQETITTVNDKSITTYQNGSKVTENSEYTKADANADTKTDRIYFTVEGAETSDEEDPHVIDSNELLGLINTGATQNVWLYTAWASDPSIITEEAVANYKANNIVLTDVTDQLDLTETEAPNESGAKYSIKFAAGKVASFEPIAKYYVVKAAYKDDTNSKNYITYKVIKVKDGSNAKKYTITSIADMTNIGSSTFTITNAPKAGTDQTAAEVLMNGGVTGAKGAIKVTNSGSKDVTNDFTITEADDSYTYTIKSKGVPSGEYTVNMGDATQTFNVSAPVWYNTASTPAVITSINLEAGNTVDVVIKDADATVMKGVDPTITAGTGATGKLTASTSDATGKITLTASKDASGAFTVAHNGASFTVYVDKYSITADPYIINAGDTEHNTANLTLANAYTGTGASSVTGKNLTSTTPAVAANLELGGSSNNGNITALAAGTTTYSYGNATCDIEVVDYVLSQAMTRDGVLTVQLKQKKAGESSYTAVSDAATSLSATGCTIESTSTPGIYKVKSSTSTTKVEFKYKKVVVADVTLNGAGTADPDLN